MSIYINQVGYKTDGTKHATIVNSNSYQLIHAESEDVVLEGSVDALSLDVSSGEQAALIDFSSVTEAGHYYFIDANGEKSYTFTIGTDVYDTVLKDAMKMFYFQRCGMMLEEKYAGKFAHRACHTADVSVLRDPKKTFSCCGGWHDAGDYGRYVTPAAVALAHLLYAYELNPSAFTEELNIPESGNGIPDILNECRYELEWMLKMQDMSGGVYHKVTSMHHTDFVMPEDDPLPFIVTPESSLATADFAGALALAARVYKPFDAQFSKELEVHARKAWEWLQANPTFVFEDPAECHTGAYDDFCDADERLWAAAELYRLTQNEDCLNQMHRILELQLSLTSLGWVDVGGFAGFAILTAPEGVFETYLQQRFRQAWLDEADRLLKVSQNNAYELALHSFDFKWGSNMVVLNDSMILCFANKLTGKQEYLEAATRQIDYILGRNAMNTSYVTGHGEGAFKNPHNRPTIVDGIDEPIPGYVSGGPNRVPCDPDAIVAIKEGEAPMKCYVDDWKSYSTNEITIYWNSPLVYTLSYLKGK